MGSGYLSTFLIEVLFSFPSRYWFTFGLIRVFSLAGGSGQINAEFLVLRVTQDTAMPPLSFGYRMITFYDAAFQQLLLTLRVQWRGPTTPMMR